MALAVAGDAGHVTVLHVVEFYIDVAVGEAVAFDLDQVRESHREQARKKLEEAVPEKARERSSLEIAVLEASGPYREILRASERDETDLIVMGVSGRSAADMFFFGSTTNHVVREAKVPVLTVRSGREKRVGGCSSGSSSLAT